MIAFSEGTKGKGDNGYNVLVGGKLFAGYADHPRVKLYETKDEFIRNGKKDYSTAAGRYQILAKYFDAYKKQLNLPDFSPESQDKIALQLIKECNALADIDDGRFYLALTKCKSRWASLPGAGYGQHENKSDTLLLVYQQAGGVIST